MYVCMYLFYHRHHHHIYRRRRHHMIVVVIRYDWDDWGQVDGVPSMAAELSSINKWQNMSFPDRGEYGRSEGSTFDGS